GPIAYAAQRTHAPRRVPHADLRPVTHLDGLVVARRTLESTVDAPPAPLDRSGWDTRWSVVLMGGEAPRLVLDASPQREAVLDALTGRRHGRPGRPHWRTGARHVLLIDPRSVPSVVDGGGVLSAGELPDAPDQFARRATRLGSARTAVIVLLRAEDPRSAVARWTTWARANGIRVILHGANGAETIADV